ncbi:MAG: TonB-dependent receptor [Porticoccaceae bacterium]|nr:TonB-dependent receptor [Porticoccaceae bacterium]
MVQKSNKNNITDLNKLAAILLLTIPTRLFAESFISEEDYLDPIPNAITATRQELPLSQSPSSVTIISRQMIEALPSTNLVDALKLVPGFQVYFANGSAAAVTANGQSDRFPRRLEIRVDDRTVYTPINSSVSWESLALGLNDIDHIEVVRGSNIAAYGANAAQGAINIITRDPLSDSGTEIQLTTGDWQTRNVALRHTLQLDSTALTVRAKYRENQGFDELNDQSYVDSLALQGVYAPNFNDELRWELGYSDGNIGFGDGDHPEEFIDEDIDTQWLMLEWKHRRDKHLFTSRFSANTGAYDRSRKNLLSAELEITPIELNLALPGAIDQLVELEVGKREYRQYDFELEHSFPITQSGQFLWGFGSRHQMVKAPDEFSSDSEKNYDSYFLFSNLQWQFSRQWGANLGMLGEQNNQSSAELSPRLSLNYHLSDWQHFRISQSIAHRQPSLYERERLIKLEILPGTLTDLTYISDPDIGAEKFETYEFAYLGYWLDGRLSIDYRLFREYLDDGIDYIKYPYPDLDGKYRLLENIATYRMSGYEAQIQLKPDPSWLISFQYSNIRLAGAIVHPSKTTQLGPRSPNHTASFLISKTIPAGWAISASGYHQSGFRVRGGAESNPSWHRYDMKLAKQWDISGDTLQLAFILQNITDEEYLEYQDGNVFERMSFVQLSLDF